jgi:hypothetical protein
LQTETELTERVQNLVAARTMALKQEETLSVTLDEEEEGHDASGETTLAAEEVSTSIDT